MGAFFFLPVGACLQAMSRVAQSKNHLQAGSYHGMRPAKLGTPRLAGRD